MKKNVRLTLEKERVKLKIKQQEYEIKKNMLDLKEKYHPLNVALNIVGDMVKPNDLAGQENITNYNTQTNTSGGLKDLLSQIAGLVQNYFQIADRVYKQNDPTPNTQETYIIGKDDK